MAFAFEKLQVYQKAVDFADQIAALTEDFPRGYGFLASQLNRASLSTATSHPEGNGRFREAIRPGSRAGSLSCGNRLESRTVNATFEICGDATRLRKRTVVNRENGESCA